MRNRPEIPGPSREASKESGVFYPVNVLSQSRSRLPYGNASNQIGPSRSKSEPTLFKPIQSNIKIYQEFHRLL